MTNRLKMILPVLLVFLLANLACNFPSSTETPPPLNQPIEQITIAPTVIVNPSEGQVSVTITQDQLTAYLVQTLQSNPDVPLSDPRIVLQNGQGELYGTLQEGPVAANATVAFTVFVDDSGQIGVNILSADVGGIPLPSAMLERVTAMVNQNMNEALQNDASGMKIENATIGDGVLTITGTKR